MVGVVVGVVRVVAVVGEVVVVGVAVVEPKVVEGMGWAAANCQQLLPQHQRR